MKSVTKLVGRVLFRNSFLPRRLAGNDCMKPKVFLSYDFCILPSGDRGWVLVTKLDCQKKKTTNNPKGRKGCSLSLIIQQL